MASGLISIAMTGINAAQTGLLTTSNNIANLSTEGYTRQRTVQASNPTVMTGAGGIGQGTHVVTVERMYSAALTKQVLSAQTSVSALDTYYDQITQIDNMLADKKAGLTPLVQEFFNAVQAVATNPSLTSSRQSMLSAADTMVAGFQSIHSRLEELEDGVNSQIGSVVDSINAYTRQIGDINNRIISASALNGQPANDLLDKRDQLVADLNELVKVNTSISDDGSYNVFVGTGQQLVVGTRTTQMAAIGSATDPSRIVVGLVGATGSVQELPESLISGGKLGGLLSFRSEALDTSFNQLGLMATAVAQTTNAQQALGRDLLGNVAGMNGFVADVFTMEQPVVTSKASAGSAVVSATLDAPLSNGTNLYTNLTASDYQLDYDGANFTLTRLSDGAVWPKSPATANSLASLNSALELDPQGFSLAGSSAVFSAGDRYLVRPTRDAARLFAVNTELAADPRKIAAGQSPLGLENSASNQVTMGLTALDYNGNATNLASLDGLSISFDGTNLDVSGLPPTATVTQTALGSNVRRVDIVLANGAKVSLSGTLTSTKTGTFTFRTNSTGVEDGSNAVKFGNLQTQNTVLGGVATYQDSYAAFVNDIGNKTATAKISSTAQTSLLGQATAARESVSGVNRDEEAAKLIEYQQAYQASAKVLEIASNLFDTLLSIGR